MLGRPEFKAMFLDDLLNGSRKQLAAPFYDIVVFERDWGFRLDEVTVPCGGGTAITTTSCRSRTVSTWCPGCKTRNSPNCRTRVTWAAWAARRRSWDDAPDLDETSALT